MRLVVTEKPSVARDLARVLGVRGKQDGYFEDEDLRIAWCFGHMAELEDPAHYDPAWKRWDPELLPMLPDRFDLRVRQGAADQVKVLEGLLRDRATTEVVNACDAGREGELIFRYLLQLAGVDKPTRRLWVSSMTDQAIRQAWDRMKEGHVYDPLGDAARCRAEADWLVGLNGTRAMTCLVRSVGGGQLLSVGRVQTPTLAMIVARDAEIEAFVPEDYWQVRGHFRPEAGGEEDLFHATWFRPGAEAGADEDDKPGRDADEDEDGKDGPPAATRLSSEAHAEAVAGAARGRPAKVAAAERSRKREKPPLLYDLTSLQRRANQRYGMSADRTLEVAQALYEQHKLITYPRTDARYLTPDQEAELPEIVAGVGQLPVYAPFSQAILDRGPIKPGKRVIDASEVGDHHAILPTGRPVDGRRLSADEKRIYDLVARRFLAALSTDAVFDTARIEIHVDPDPAVALPPGIEAPLCFRARGRIRVEAGWQAADPPKQRAERDLPQVEVGDPLHTEKTEIKADRTRPPPPHNDASILKAMETAGRALDDAALRRVMRQAGLGTPATRAAILQTLIQRGYVERRGKPLISTPRGRSLIAAVPVDELKSAELTGRWEARLGAIADGRESREGFMRDVRARTGEIVAAILAAEPPPAEVLTDERPVLGACPVCGTPVREGRAAYSCDKGRACSFVVFKKVAKREVSPRMVKQLLTRGRTDVLKGFKSKAGKAFEVALALDPEGKVVFEFPPREGAAPAEGAPAAEGRPAEGRPAEGKKPAARKPAAPRKAPDPKKAPDPLKVPDPAGLPCPACGQGRIIRGRTGWGCDRWRQGCGWRRLDPG